MMEMLLPPLSHVLAAGHYETVNTRNVVTLTAYSMSFAFFFGYAPQHVES